MAIRSKKSINGQGVCNRLWQEFFGLGFVKSSFDFGMQGDLPSHPQLLDWLAVDFMQNGWNVKRLVKQLVMSATYRQSAEVNKEKLDADPENIYLSRAPRLRVPAEMVKDLVLSSSGLLNKAIGGPSVKPYQPPGLWNWRHLEEDNLQHTGRIPVTCSTAVACIHSLNVLYRLPA
jgi:hypothetical protein